MSFAAYRATACVLSLAFAALGLVACADDDGGNADTAGAGSGGSATQSGGAASGGDDNQAGAPSDAPPAILLVERVFTPSSRSYYVSVLSEMPSGPVDRTKAREFGSADIEVFGGAFYLRSREDNSMTRFTVNAENELVEGARFSFQNVGLGVRRFHTAYISPTQAYTIDNEGWRLIEWDPTAMELTGNEISLSYLEKAGLPNTQIVPPVRFGDRLLGGVIWENIEKKVICPGTGGLIFDADGSAPKLVEDARIGGGYKVNLGEGAAYTSGIMFGSALFRTAVGGGEVPPSGVLRVKEGEEEFDPDYVLNLSEITGSPSVYGVHRVDETHTLVQMFDPESPTDVYETEDDFSEASEYIYGLVDNEAGTWSRVETIPKGGAGNTLSHVVDGKLYVQSYDAESAEALVYAVDSDGVSPAFSVPAGDLWYLQRVR